MKTLYMHIGHGKTGSSFIQASLAQSVENLLLHNISYPISEKDRALGVAEHISTGNGWEVLASVDTLNDWLGRNKAGKDQSILLSSEILFDQILLLFLKKDAQVTIDDLAQLISRNGFTNVNILLFVRNPEDFLSSAWQQWIKRSGETRKLDAAAADIGFWYITASARLIAALETHPFFSIKLVNYSSTDDVLAPVADWLNVPRDLIRRPSKGKINRSLTRSEVEFVRLLNLHFSEQKIPRHLTERFSDTLCNELPDIQAEHSSVSRAVADRLWKDSELSLSILNDRLEPEDRIYRKAQDDCVDANSIARSALTFSPEQIELITKTISEILGEHLAQLSNASHNRASAQVPPGVSLPQLQRVEAELTDKTSELVATKAALQKAWRDPIPHLLSAYRRKIKAGLRKWRIRL